MISPNRAVQKAPLLWGAYHLKFVINLKAMNLISKFNSLKWVVFGVLTLGCSLFVTSCKETIDESNFAIQKEMTAADFLDSNPEYSLMKEVFQRVPLGVEGGSSLYNVLSARGNYTLFLANNAAVEAFLEANGVTCIDSLSYEMLSLLAKSGIVDNGNDRAYETPDLPTSGALILPNLNDRILSCHMDENSRYFINGESEIIDEDNEVSNGMIHIVSAVIAPSALTLDKQIAAANNLKVFSYLLDKTGWAEQMHENLDKSYENPNRIPKESLGEFVYTHAVHRYVGYTALVEPDSVFEVKLGLKVQTDEEGNLLNGDDFVNKIAEKVGKEQYYGAAAGKDLTDPDHPVNKFVAYHLMYGKMSYNRLVYHYNEYGYKYGNWANPQMNEVPTNVWEFYTTMGKYPALLKITQVGDGGFEHDTEHRIYANRISIYANGHEEDYHEKGVVPGYQGLLIHAMNGNNDNNALNGYYYPIDELLVYSDGLRNEISRRRVRMDIVATLPELATNNIRGNNKICFDRNYFDRFVKQNSSTKVGYSHAQGSAWNALWGDEFRIFGLYDFTYKLPPVPKDGTYEVRMCCSHGSIRGMAQIYFGDDPERLTPAGLPYDMRQTPSEDNPSIPWFVDTEDWDINMEKDKNMKNQGFMKGPRYYTRCTDVDAPIRNVASYIAIRRIITTAYMEAGKDYYIRFKSALKKTDAELNIDFFEYASTAVFNGVEAEDIW